ncbi:amino acid permease/ SLC12A domain-containing protein [Trichophaea hybrida]|nr:amino acid permease/ SLC12A domain-containing protein [Trichophaea hybrida]
MSTNSPSKNRPYGSHTLRRNLEQRHISMIALSATIGFGLTIGSGRVLQLAGPGGALLAYAITGFLAWAVMGSLGEMTSLMNVSGPLRELPALFVDDSLGLAVGWFYWITYVMAYACESLTTGQIMRFKYNDTLRWHAANVNTEVWILLSQITTIAVNFLSVRVYGEMEYWFGAIKIIGLSILIFAMFLINIGKDWWNNCRNSPVNSSVFCPNATGFFANGFVPNRTIGSNDADTVTGSYGTFAAIWTVIIITLYAYVGLDLTAVTAAESENPKEDIKMANRKTITRTIILYLFGVFFVSLNVPYDDKTLLRLDQGINEGGGGHSPFIIAFAEAGIPSLANFANILFVFAAWSAGTAFLYAASRTLHSLAAENRIWPQVLGSNLNKVNRFGVPHNAVIACSLVGLLGFLGTGKDKKPQEALDIINRISSVSWVIVLASVCITYLRFKKTLEVRKKSEGDAPEFDRDSPQYPYRTIWQPSRACFGLVACIIVILFNGWRAFLHYKGTMDGTQRREFVGSYLAPILFVILYVGSKVYDRWNNDSGWGFKNPKNTTRALFSASMPPLQAAHLETTPPPVPVTDDSPPEAAPSSAVATDAPHSEVTLTPIPETGDEHISATKWKRKPWLLRQFIFWFT